MKFRTDAEWDETIAALYNSADVQESRTTHEQLEQQTAEMLLRSVEAVNKAEDMVRRYFAEAVTTYKRHFNRPQRFNGTEQELRDHVIATPTVRNALGDAQVAAEEAADAILMHMSAHLQMEQAWKEYMDTLKEEYALLPLHGDDDKEVKKEDVASTD